MFLLIITIYLVIISSNANERLPKLWNEAPSSISDYPFVKNNSTASHLINPWLYLDRLGLYKILIITTTPLMPFCSLSNASNILFGLPAQFSWQFDSNRLFSNGTQQISTDSWWASANYYLSVIPFLAAVDVGIIQQGSFQIVKQGNFCSNSDECFRQVPEAMIKWRQFFSNLSQPNYCKNDHIDDRIIDKCYLNLMWSAHVASIEHALPLIASKVSLLPSYNEQQFGLGWANIVDFLGMSRENTNLSKVNTYQDEFFPERMLTANDKPPHCSDLSKTVNQALELLFSIREEWFPELRILWKRATCNFESRQDAQHVIETVAISKSTAAAYYSEAILKSYLHKCDQ
ncbi:unnamed protein product [Adineta steineri]|uniref:Uncharacterized protein n=2 Tax=Adineta steineri TaxID=433720 RepID=A0A819W5I4_9BILA|nr:unnamed protein product [Adineta steineri]CAF4118657.1 unnamed protein product [Adineta steineri]